LKPDSPSDALVVAARSAYPEYLRIGAYICQAGRSFRPGIDYMAFYAERQIKREVAKILHRRDNVPFTLDHSDRLRERNDDFDREVADLIRVSLDPGSVANDLREEGRQYQVFVLSGPKSEDTIHLPQAIYHAGVGAWTQGQRYVSAAVLRSAPATTDQL
jgi:hypothetical protein